MGWLADEMDGPTAMDIVNETAEEVNELLCVIEAQQKHAAQMVEIINQAFMADAPFKKPEFFMRTNLAQLERQLKEKRNETFLVAIAGARVVGSIHIHWEPDRDEAHFGMLSVDPRRQRQGIGRRLVAAAEEFALHKLRRRLLSMPILTTRPDLLPWYQKQGFEVSHEEDPTPEYAHIWNQPVRFLWMRKSLV